MPAARRCFFGLALLIWVGPAARGAIVPVAQARGVVSFGSASVPPDQFDNDYRREDAPDFAAFDELVGVAIRVGPATADGFASQRSSYGPTAITAELAADAFVSTLQVDQTAEAGSASGLELEFDLDRPQSVWVEASVGSSNNGYAYLALRDALNYFVELDSFGSLDFSGAIHMPAGRYLLIVSCSASGNVNDGVVDGIGRAQFSLVVVPEPSGATLVVAGAGLLGLAGRRVRPFAWR